MDERGMRKILRHRRSKRQEGLIGKLIKLGSFHAVIARIKHTVILIVIYRLSSIASQSCNS